MISLLVFLLLADNPPSPASLLQNGLVALQHGQLQEARKDLEQASAIDPKNSYVWTSLADVYFRLNELKLSESAAQKAEKTAAGNPVVCHALAMYYSKRGDPSKAAPLEKTFAQSPKADPKALSRAASLYLESGNAKEAVELARQANERDASAANQDLLGRALTAEGDAEQGAPYVASAWQGSKTDPQIAFDWAQILFRKGDFTGGSEAIETALAAHPHDAQLMLALGVARYGQRRFEEAIATFLEVIRIDPQIDQSYEFLGRMLDQSPSKLDEIIKAFEARAAAHPRNAKAQLLLAKALLTLDAKSARAEPLLRQSIAIDPGDWEAHYELGVLLEGKHNYQQAAEELSRGIQLSPNQPMPHYHLARVYDRLGEPERAKAEREIHQKLIGTANLPEVR